MIKTEPTQVEFEKWRRKNLGKVTSGLSRILDRLSVNQSTVVTGLLKAMRYSLLGGGKRIRPLLALAAAEAVGGETREALPVALAVEMIHAYSLVHDDLPAMDNDSLRRGRLTCHKLFGEATAILAGDALFTLAFETLANYGRKNLEACRRINLILTILARAVGALGLVGGQALDLAMERRPAALPSLWPSVAEIRDMELRKTGELMAAALIGGAHLVGARPVELRRLRQIGLNLGLAFQIKDDLLNQAGDPARLGKAVGSDAVRGKATFPAVCGTIETERELNELTEKTLGLTLFFKYQGRNLKSLIVNLVDRQI